jgi:CheY-like chemotaxis protein
MRLASDTRWRSGKILVVGDRYLQADLVCNYLRDWGLDVVGPTGRLREACRFAAECALDGALLDVTLDDGLCFPVCTILKLRRIPFAFVSGYGDQSIVPGAFRAAPVVCKPFDEHALRSALTLIVPGDEQASMESPGGGAGAGGNTVYINRNSPEQVAYELLKDIAFAEGKRLRGGGKGQRADPDYILRTYWDCWRVVQGVGTEELDDIPSEGTPEPPHASPSRDRHATASGKMSTVIDFHRPERD